MVQPLNWSVSCTGYVTQSGAHTVVGDFTKDVLLSVQYCTYTINPVPANATVTMNGVARKSISVAYGTTVSCLFQRNIMLLNLAQ